MPPNLLKTMTQLEQIEKGSIEINKDLESVKQYDRSDLELKQQQRNKQQQS